MTKGWMGDWRDRFVSGWGITTLTAGLLVTLLLALVTVRVAGRDLAEDLAGRGSSHVAALVDIGTAAVSQAEGMAAFFEASEDVTEAEFARFTARALAEPISRVSVAFAFDDDGVRRPISFDDGEPVELIVALAAGRRDIGLAVGDSLDGHPDRVDLIQSSAATGAPASGVFVEVEGDDQPGDVLVVATARNPSGEVLEAVMATVQLDEILEHQIESATEGVEWSLAPGPPQDPAGPDTWAGRFDLAGSEMWLVGRRAVPPSQSGLWTVLIVGFGLSVAAAWIVQAVQSERQAMAAADTLRRAAEDKDRFLAGIGHQLRTPLTAVVGMLDLISSDRPPVGEGVKEEFLETARAEAHKLAELIDRFLIAGRISVDTLTVLDEEFDFEDVLAEALQRVDRPVHVVLETHGAGGRCQGDALRVRQVLHSLIENACRHARSSVIVALTRADDHLEVRVSNDGDPIPARLSEQVFEPFLASSEDGQPSRLGIGLWIARELSRRMGGNLEHVAAPDVTTFVFRLRAAAPARTESLSAATSRSSGADPADATSHRLITVVQPIVDIEDIQIAGFEAFTRDENGRSWWDLQTRYDPVSLQREALARALALRDGRPGATFLSVNVDSPLLAHPEIAATFAGAGDLSAVVVEMSEHQSLFDPTTLTVIAALREAGAVVAVDDFGAGHIGVNRLETLEPEIIKIDGRLIDRLPHDPAARSVLRTVVEIGSRFDAAIVAEKVETMSQLEILAEYQIPMAQGYLLARPGEPWPDIDRAVRSRLAAVANNYGEMASIARLVEPITSGPGARGSLRSLLTDSEGRILAIQDGEVLINDPTVVHVGDSAREVLRRANSRPAGESRDPLVAVDAAGHPVGVVTVDRLAAAVSSHAGSV